MARKLSRASLVKKADRVFSRWVRNHHSQSGWADCVTCKRRFPVEQLHAGHFVKRSHMAVRWDERNVHPQCVACNTYRGGCQDEYAKFILDTYGGEVLNDLLALKHTIRKWSVGELRELIERYEVAT